MNTGVKSYLINSVTGPAAKRLNEEKTRARYQILIGKRAFMPVGGYAEHPKGWSGRGAGLKTGTHTHLQRY